MAGVYLPADMFDGAWASLSPAAAKLLVDMASLVNGRNNGAIPYSVPEAARLLRCDRGEAAAVFRELEHFGFIASTGAARGRGDGAGRGSPRTWTISLWPGRPPVVPERAEPKRSA